MCKRSFARQDALARHEKLHTRRDGIQYLSPPSSQVSRQGIPNPNSTRGLSIPENNVTVDRGSQNIPSPQDGGGHSRTVNGASLTADLDFDLIWPDSEELFENLMLLDSSNQWHTSLGTLPISMRSHSINNVCLEDGSPPHDKTSSIGVIPSGESHQAVHNVSEMVTALVSFLCH